MGLQDSSWMQILAIGLCLCTHVKLSTGVAICPKLAPIFNVAEGGHALGPLADETKVEFNGSTLFVNRGVFDRYQGSSVTYRCKEGYRPLGYILVKGLTIRCQRNGTWSTRPPNCTKQDCGLKPCHDNATCSYDVVGSVLCKCKRGYTGDGRSSCANVDECDTGAHSCHQRTARCVDTMGSFYCNYTTCPSLAPIHNIKPDNYSFGSHTAIGTRGTSMFVNSSRALESVTYFCQPGYRPLAYNQHSGWTILCQENGTWSTVPPECTKQDCDLKPCHDDAVCSYTAGGAVFCECAPGYEGDGRHACENIDECVSGADGCEEGISRCVDTMGSFYCQYTTCPSLAPIHNIKPDNYSFGSHTVIGTRGTSMFVNSSRALESVTYFCQPGYRPLAYNQHNGWTILCQENGTWSAVPPECTKQDCGLRPCHDNATCSYTATGAVLCTCAPGYEGDGRHACENIDECATGADGCDEDRARCVDTHGSFLCHCKYGSEQLGSEVTGGRELCKPYTKLTVIMQGLARAEDATALQQVAARLLDVSVTLPADITSKQGSTVLLTMVEKSLKLYAPERRNTSEEQLFLTNITRTTVSIISNAMEELDRPAATQGNSRSSDVSERMRSALSKLSNAVPVDTQNPLLAVSPNLALAIICGSENLVSTLSVLRDSRHLQFKQVKPASGADWARKFEMGNAAGVQIQNIRPPNATNAAESCRHATPLQMIAYDSSSLFGRNRRSGHHSRDQQVGGVVVSVAFRGHEHYNLADKTVKLSFRVPEISRQVACSFWNESEGAWSQSGCRTTSVTSAAAIDNRTTGPGSGIVECECNHLTSFAVLLLRGKKIAGRPERTKDNIALSLLSYIGCGLSVICLIMTSSTILYFKKLRNKQFQRMILQISVALILVMLLVSTGLSRRPGGGGGARRTCQAVAVALHAGLLTLFGLMMATSAHLYVKIVTVYSGERVMRISRVLAYGLPGLIVLLTAALSKLDAYGTDDLCWLHGDGVHYGTFVTPLLVMLAFNATVLILIVRQLLRNRRRGNSIGDGAAKGRRRVSLVFVVLSVTTATGLTWLSGVFLVAHPSIVLQFIFVSLSSTQGITLFLFHTVKSPDVRKQLAQLRSLSSLMSSMTTSVSRRTKPGARGMGTTLGRSPSSRLTTPLTSTANRRSAGSAVDEQPLSQKPCASRRSSVTSTAAAWV